MAETEIKALELVRRIRDEHYERTKDMSMEELLQFYRREADAANAEAQSRLAKRTTAIAQ
ncbi:MAG TPA: hypothetical protein VKM72_22590 [Thermoanaerobaculia bacterium]|nr:hypothetical protein [Thermoanaerobaculia bacterium]